MKNYRQIGVLLAGIFLYSGVGGQAQNSPSGQAGISAEQRAENLIARMTLEEKVGQMTDRAQAIPRLGIPEYNWWNECLHGVARAGTATVFPQAIGLAATFDTDLMYTVADVISTEARAKHHEAVRNGNYRQYTGLTMWSPNVNIFRDPRWGRGQETYGEDPFLTSRMGVAFVKGLQGADPDFYKVIATPKHYAVHSGPEPERHEFNAVTSTRALYDTYLPAFEACVKEGGAYSVMCAYNRMMGKACCGSPPLMQTILRDIWGFKGYVVSDCGAIDDIHATHHLVETRPEAAALAVKSGTDLNCGRAYSALDEAVGLGLISEAELDVSLKRLFTARYKLGMFDSTGVPYAQIPFEKNDCAEHGALAKRAAEASLVLLKNENHFLPLSPDLDTIAVIGPNADRVSVLLGNYHGTPSSPVTILQGIREKAGSRTVVLYETGCFLADKYGLMRPIPETILSHDNTKGLLAEYYKNADLDGEPAVVRSETDINYNWWQQNDFPDLGGSETFSIRWTGVLTPEFSGDYIFFIRGTRGYRFSLDGNVLTDKWVEGRPERDRIEISLVAGKPYPIEVTYTEGRRFPFISLMWAGSDEGAQARAVALARSADVVVFTGGISPDLEGEEMEVPYEGFSGGDRTKIGLPSVQENLLKALVQTGTPVVLVLNSGSAMAVNWANENIPAILQTWYPGQAGGAAVADVLFGDANPAGRLPVTFYKSIDQLPPFDDYSMEGHTYRYFRQEPLYAFGYGMSYTQFDYSRLSLPQKMNTEDTISVTIQVRNSGAVAGDEVVQLYIKDVKASAPVPLWSLQGFQRIHLCPGEQKTVAFTLTPKQLSLITDDLKRVVEPGEFVVAAGGGLPGQCAQTTEVLTRSLHVDGKVKVLETLYWEAEK